jgi:hypothetical protein
MLLPYLKAVVEYADIKAKSREPIKTKPLHMKVRIKSNPISRGGR